MKKRTVLVGMLAALTMFAAGCGGKDAAKESKVLRAGTEPTFAPFEFQEKDSKDFTGFDMDLIRAPLASKWAVTWKLRIWALMP